MVFVWDRGPVPASRLLFYAVNVFAPPDKNMALVVSDTEIIVYRYSIIMLNITLTVYFLVT